MCGRYAVKANQRLIAELFGAAADDSFVLVPRYNVAPTQVVPVVVQEDSGRQLRQFHWGLVPAWESSQKGAKRLFNARAETVDTLRTYKKPFQMQRCLMVADGFYEWRTTPDGKSPRYFSLKSGEPFGFAGIWNPWKFAGDDAKSCALITTDRNELVAEIHNRMPVILHPDDYDLWLDAGVGEAERLKALLKPFPADQMQAWDVSPGLVNSSKHDGADCIAPLKA